jgi:quercetin dioxygenase-like cupin family protein
MKRAGSYRYPARSFSHLLNGRNPTVTAAYEKVNIAIQPPEENIMGLVRLDELPELQIAEGILARVVTAETVTVAHVKLAAGALLPEHAHHHEQVVNVIEGELELTVDGQPYSLKRGKVMVLTPNVVHSGRAVTDCRVVDVFHPVREDFRGASFGGYTERGGS